VEGRLVTKTYADSSTVTYAYENTTSRLKSVTDALGQVKTYSYTPDNRVSAIAYTGAVNPTPNVSFAYDPYFPRATAMTDGTGTTSYAYVPVGSLGALQLQSETTPLASGAISYAYDALGRLSSRTVQGSGAETFAYDAIGRLTSHGSDLGSFTLGYLGQTAQPTSRALSGASLATTWSYLPKSGDRRLQEISTAGLSAGQFTTFQYSSNAEGQTTGTTQTSDATIAYPTTGTQTASYNNLNQITNVSGQAYSYDADGNLLSDGSRTYSWDAENRLVAIAYPGMPGKATAFAYDGLGRRTAITSTPGGGGSPVTTSYIWCGSEPCQARDSGNAVTRSYYDEGEFLPGSPAQSYYYAPDRIGSVRRVFGATGSPTYDYDPYGVPLQTTAAVTDFGYAGMFGNPDSGLGLTWYRGYDPVGNLYAYVGDNPVASVDSWGLCDNDKCKDLSKKIDKARNQLAKRSNDLQENRLGLPMYGPMSIRGHIQQFKDKQANLRKLLDEYNANGCGDGNNPISSDVWTYATMRPPKPGGLNFSSGEVPQGLEALPLLLLLPWPGNPLYAGF